MKTLKKFVSIALAVLTLCSALLISGFDTSALSIRQGYITGDGVNIRTGPATSYQSLGKLSNNTPVVVTGVGFNGTNKTIWYKLTATTASGNINGYVHNDYVKITGSDKSYAAVMTRASSIFSHAGDWNEKLCAAPKGMALTVIGEELDYDGDKWYQVIAVSNGQTVEGYAYSECLQLDTYKEDADFEAYLTAQGFPESYKVKLRQVHGLYPNWKFVADHIEPDWNAAVAGETAKGVNTVAPSAVEAWKSMDNGAYDWATGKYEVWDSGGWVEAADNVVKYYLDPRNFLNTGSEIFQFIKMNYDPKLNTKENLQGALKGTFMEGAFPESSYATYADVLMAAAQKSGVSPISLAAMIIVEQGSQGTGKSISGVQPGYEGYYNFYNVGAYAGNGNSAVTNGLIYAKNHGWNTRAAAIIGGAEFYASEYINRGQNNLYYKKFNVVYKNYFTHQYMTNVQAAAHEAQQTAKGYASLSSTELIFNIPVYKNIPDTVMPYPTKTGNNNCYLNDISLNGHNYTPTFNRYTENYEAIVEGDVDKIVVTPVKSYSGATVTGGGAVNLAVGNNNINITVTSTSGLKKVYTVSVFRKTPPLPTIEDPEIHTTVYNVGQTNITGIMPSTSKEVFITNLNVVNGTSRVSSTGDIIKTGDTVEILDSEGTVRYTYRLFVAFDTNCDGKCTLIDLSLLKRHLLKIAELSGDSLISADVNYDGRLSINDLSLIKRRLLKIDS